MSRIKESLQKQLSEVNQLRDKPGYVTQLLKLVQEMSRLGKIDGKAANNWIARVNAREANLVADEMQKEIGNMD